MLLPPTLREDRPPRASCFRPVWRRRGRTGVPRLRTVNHPPAHFLNRLIHFALPGLILAAPFALAQNGGKSSKATPPRTTSSPQPGAKPRTDSAAMGIVDGIPITEAEWDR